MTGTRAPRFQNANVLRMFPSFVWKAELAPEIHRPLGEAILRKLGEIGAPLADLAPGESWQSDHGLHEIDEFRTLVDLVGEAVEALLRYLQVGSREMRMTGLWANLNAPGAGHAVHSHPNNFISGVYYLRAPEGADMIGFHDPRPQVGIIRPPVRALSAENADLVAVKVKEGMLLLFPAWLQHSVDPNRSRALRISIGFNLMFPSYAETMSAPFWEGGRRRAT